MKWIPFTSPKGKPTRLLQETNRIVNKSIGSNTQSFFIKRPKIAKKHNFIDKLQVKENDIDHGFEHQAMEIHVVKCYFKLMAILDENYMLGK